MNLSTRSTATAGVLFLAVLSCPLRPAEAAREGCPALAEPAAAYKARAAQARAARDYRRAADELWLLWCRAGQASTLVQLCAVHAEAGDCARGREMARYSYRRMKSLPSEERQALRQCYRKLNQSCPVSAGAEAPAAVELAQEAPVPAAPEEGAGAGAGTDPAAPAEGTDAPRGEGAATATADPAAQAAGAARPAPAEAGTLRLIVGGGSADGARFFVDDLEYQERDALSSPGLRLPVGRRLVVVQKEGYAEFRREVELMPGGTAVIYVPLRPRKARVRAAR